MQFFIKKFTSFFKLIISNNVHSERFINHNNKIWKNFINKEKKKELIIDYYESYETELARSYFSNIFSLKNNCKIVVASNSLNILFKKDWRKIYKSFNVTKFLYIYLNKIYILNLINFKKRKRINSDYIFITQGIKKKQDLLDICYKGTEIGREIYEEYLYRYRKVTVDLKDPKIYKLIKECLYLVNFWHDYLKNKEVEALCLSHPNVRFMGLSGKIANLLFIPVYSVTNSYIKKNLNLNPHKDFIKKNLLNYPKIFNQLNSVEKNNAINWSKEKLQRRFDGEVGVDMFYSDASAFQKFSSNEPRILPNNEKIKIIICTHEFYDGPHSTGGLLFNDFYEWLIFLGNKSNNSQYDWYIKNHPDCDSWTTKEIDAFAIKYPKIKLINKNVSFLQLAKEGINFALTCHGTVGLELPLLNIQVINSDINNPHIAYKFNWNPLNIKEYDQMLSDLPNLNIKINYDEIYSFYYASKKLGQYDNLIFKSYSKAKEIEKKTNKHMLEIFLNDFNLLRHDEIKDNINNLLLSL